MSQDQIKKFLKANEGQKYTAHELLYHLKKGKNNQMSYLALCNCLTALCKHNDISYEACIIRKMSGREFQGKIYFYNPDGLQISSFVHVENIIEELKIKELFKQGYKKVKQSQ